MPFHWQLKKLKSFWKLCLDALSNQKQSNQKLTMALPINFPELVYTDHLSLQVALFTIVSLLLSFFILPQDSESEGEEQDLRLTETFKPHRKDQEPFPHHLLPRKSKEQSHLLLFWSLRLSSLKKKISPRPRLNQSRWFCQRSRMYAPCLQSSISSHLALR